MGVSTLWRRSIPIVVGSRVWDYPQLGTITAETLIVFGDRDPLYPVSLSFDLRSAIKRSYLWVVPNAGHGPVFGDHAPQFAATALAFLKGAWSHSS